MLTEKKQEVEILAKELLDKEVLHKSDVEELIGRRPFEEKKLLEISAEQSNGHAGQNIPGETIAPPETTVIS